MPSHDDNQIREALKQAHLSDREQAPKFNDLMRAAKLSELEDRKPKHDSRRAKFGALATLAVLFIIVFQMNNESSAPLDLAPQNSHVLVENSQDDAPALSSADSEMMEWDEEFDTDFLLDDLESLDTPM